MNKIFTIMLVVVLSGCAIGKDNVYGCCIGQTVEGNKKHVSVSNVWNAVDGLPLAQAHCQKYNANAVITGHSGITALYKCLKQSIIGNKNYVTVIDYGDEEESLSFAEIHCAKYDKSANYRETNGYKVIFDCE